MTKELKGLIDLGSNSIRLIIYTIAEPYNYKEIHNLKVTARISNHLDSKGNITEQGIQKIIETLRSFEAITRYYQVHEVDGAATAAVRQAPNKDEVLRRIEQETGFTFRVLSETEEAYYGYLAITSSMDLTEGITIDIGGGSTEVTLFENRQLIHSHSFPFGAISLTKRFIQGEIPTNEELVRLVEFLQSQFNSLPWLVNKGYPVIGIGGSARNLTLMHQRSMQYPLPGIHHYEITPMDIFEICERLSQLPLQVRQKVDGLSKDRADIIIPALKAIFTLCSVVNAPSFVMSVKGLRDGMIYEQINEIMSLSQPMPYWVKSKSMANLVREFDIDQEQRSQVMKLGIQLIQALVEKENFILTENEVKLFKYACKIAYLGEVISQEASSQHTYYLLTNRTIEGFNHQERLWLALIASFKSNSTFQEYIKPYKHLLHEPDIIKIEILGATLRLAYSLDRTKRKIVQSIQKIPGDTTHIHLQINVQGDYQFEEQQAANHKKHLERALKRKIKLFFKKQ